MEIVIQAVSVVLYGPTVPPYETQLTTIGGGNFVSANIPLFAQGPGYYMAVLPLTQYIDPLSTTPSCSSFAAVSSPSATFTCSISGYTVSLP